MTALVHQSGLILVEWLQKNLAGVFSIVFALGFAWSQFGAVEAAIAETRLELRDLRREFVAFRIAGQGVTRDELAELLGRQHDVDRRQDAALASVTEQLLRASAGPPGAAGPVK